jgi:1-acyl-sn-glycerol-3-phosphate acyltransferase
MESGAPVIPVAMFNTNEIQPTGKLMPKIKRVRMEFGEPMYFTGDSTNLNTLRDVTDEIMRKIQSMSGQEYVDIYASKRKSEIAEED